MSRMFTDDQLREIAEPPAAKARRALVEGDTVRLAGLLNEMASGPAGVEGLTLHVLSRFIGELRADFGEDDARALLDRIGAQMMRSFVADYAAGDERRAIVDLVSVFKHQGGGTLVPVEETDDAVVFDLTPCGSGGRFVVDGTAEKSPRWYGPWSDGVPSYCQACKACQRALNEAAGDETWTTTLSSTTPGRCTMRFGKRASRGTRLFPGTEIYAVTRTRIQTALERVSRHDYRIEELLDDQHRDWMPWHDFAISLAAYVFAICEVERGTSYLTEKLDLAYNSVFRLFYPVFRKLGDEPHLRYLCKAHHYHMMSFTLTEEDDRFVFRLDPCGSGGRLYRGEMWRNLFEYGGPLSPRISQPSAITFGREEFPVYCTHCASHNRDEFAKDVLYFVNDGHAQMRPGMACFQFTYKKGVHVAQVDRRLLEQVGFRLEDSNGESTAA